MNKKPMRKVLQGPLMYLLLLAIILLVVHMESLVRFNRTEVQIQGNDSVGGVQMQIAHARKDQAIAEVLHRQRGISLGKTANNADDASFLQDGRIALVHLEAGLDNY